MKTGKYIQTLVIAALLLAAGRSASAQVNVNFQTFYDELSPYGQWMQNPEYGQVWVPNAGQDFQPYGTAGHWDMTDYGNTWVSDYPWGWAPFHYGRWTMDPRWGWSWIPGYEWGPAWVGWRTGGGYYGWAPLGPGMSINVNINLPWNYWVFVPQTYIYRPRIYGFCVPRTRVVNVYHSTTIINNVYQYNNRSFFSGPSRYDVQRATGRTVDVRRAEDYGRRAGFYDGRNDRGGYNRNDNRGFADNRGGRDNRDFQGNRQNNNTPDRNWGDRQNGNMPGNRQGNTDFPGNRDNTPDSRGSRQGNSDFPGNRNNTPDYRSNRQANPDFQGNQQPSFPDSRGSRQGGADFPRQQPGNPDANRPQGSPDFGGRQDRNGGFDRSFGGNAPRMEGNRGNGGFSQPRGDGGFDRGGNAPRMDGNRGNGGNGGFSQPRGGGDGHAGGGARGRGGRN